MADFDVRNPAPKDRLIVPLDLPSVAEAKAMIDRLGESVSFYKLGYQVLYAGGFDLIKELIDEGKKVFVDLKLLDIDNTVEKGVASLSDLGATFLTTHAYPKAMRAAVKGKGNSKTCLLGVTVLTSMDDDALIEAGYTGRVGELVIKRARQAYDAGMDGIVCSAAEASAIRTIVGPDLLLVTPGIRPANGAQDDQKRIMTPSHAIQNGSDYLVVGRPILNADDPKAAAERIVAEIETALN